jgi:hypothetical protein
MIGSVLMLLQAEEALLRSGLILGWFLLFLLGNALYFPLVEEKELEKRFGESYARYKRHVPRWFPRLRAWRDDDRDNSDSAAKLRLGRKWADKAGGRYRYFMVFQNRELRIDGTYALDEFMGIMQKL